MKELEATLLRGPDEEREIEKVGTLQKRKPLFMGGVFKGLAPFSIYNSIRDQSDRGHMRDPRIRMVLEPRTKEMMVGTQEYPLSKDST